MKLSVMVGTMLLAATTVSATEATIKDIYGTTTLCTGKSEVQGGVEGALIGSLLGSAISDGDKDTAQAFGIFGLIVGANEAPGRKCSTVKEYSYSTITFTDNGKTYTLSFIK